MTVIQSIHYKCFVTAYQISCFAFVPTLSTAYVCESYTGNPSAHVMTALLILLVCSESGR